MSTEAVCGKKELEFTPFEDPISHEEIVKAVILPCGHTFGEKSITVWVKDENHQTCPTCNTSAKLSDFIPNFALRETIQSFPDFVKKQVAMAVDAQTETLKNTYKRELEKRTKQIEDLQTPTGSEIIVDWRRIYHHQKAIEDENRKNGNNSYTANSHLFAHDILEYRHLIFHHYLEEQVNSFGGIRTLLVQLYQPNELAQKDSFGRTTLHLAVRRNHTNSIKNILRKIPPKDLAIQDVTGSTALHYAAEANNNKNEIHDVISAMRAENLAITDENGKTFMHRFQYYSDKITLLFAPIIEKVSPKLLGMTDSQGYTPLHYAIKRIIICRNIHRDQIIEAFCKKMRPEDLNKVYANGGNFLHFTIKNSSPIIICLLVKYMKESAKNEKDQDGKTPLELLDANCQNNSYYTQARPHLIYREPIAQIQNSVQFSMGENVHHKVNRDFGVGTISETKYDLDTQTVTYAVIFPDMNSLKMTVKGEDLEKA